MFANGSRTNEQISTYSCSVRYLNELVRELFDFDRTEHEPSVDRAISRTFRERSFHLHPYPKREPRLV